MCTVHAFRAKKPTPFEILGVSPADDVATIRKAWKALVRQNHPDRTRGDRVEATRKLAELNAAFDKLRNHVPIKPRHAPHPDFAAEAGKQAEARATARAAAREAARAKATAETEARLRAEARAAAEKAARLRAARERAARAAAEELRRAQAATRPMSAAELRALKQARDAFATAANFTAPMRPKARAAGMQDRAECMA